MYTEGWASPQLSDDAFVTTDSRGAVEIKVSNSDFIPEDALCCPQIGVKSARQARLVFLRPKQVDAVCRPVLIRELGKVSIERGLGCGRARDLDAVAECLKSLLLPEH